MAFATDIIHFKLGKPCILSGNGMSSYHMWVERDRVLAETRKIVITRASGKVTSTN